MVASSEASVDEVTDNARLLMEQVQTQLGRQLDISDTLDSKAQLVLTSGSIVITIGSGFVGIGATNGLASMLCLHVGRFSLGVTPLCLYIFALVLYLIAMVLSGWAYFVRTYSLVPDPTKLVGRYFEKPSSEVMRKIAKDTVEAFERNEKTLSSKAKLVKLALVSFLFETVAVAASLVLLAIS